MDYGKIRPLFGGKLKQSQVDGIETILKVMRGQPKRYTAYAFATTFLETAQTMQPIKEYGGKAYFTRMYDIKGNRPKKARELGNLTPGDGAKYPGRGYVQLTGKTNYTRATERLKGLGIHVDLVNNPDDAMRPDVAAMVMLVGMTDGWFTGKKFSDYLDQEPPDYVNARLIINGTDKAEHIAGLARAFEAAL